VPSYIYWHGTNSCAATRTTASAYSWIKFLHHKRQVSNLTKKFPIFMEPKIHHCTHNSHSHFPILRQINSIYALPTYLFKIQLILFSSRLLDLPSGLFPSAFLTKTLPSFIFSPHFPYVQAIMCPFILHSNNIWWGAPIMNLFTMKFLLFPVTFFS